MKEAHRTPLNDVTNDKSAIRINILISSTDDYPSTTDFVQGHSIVSLRSFPKVQQLRADEPGFVTRRGK